MVASLSDAYCYSLPTPCRGFDDEEGAGSVSGKSAKSGAAAGLEGEDGNLLSNISNVSNVVVGRVGNMFGKGIGGLSSKLGGGWF